MGWKATTPVAARACGGLAVAVGVGGEEVHSGHAVDVGVHEAGHGHASGPGGTEAHGRDRTVLNLHIAVHEPSVDERGPYSKAHPAPLLLV